MQIAIDLKGKSGSKLKDFRAALEAEVPAEVAKLKEEVEVYAQKFPTIGFDKGYMKYKQ